MGLFAALSKYFFFFSRWSCSCDFTSESNVVDLLLPLHDTLYQDTNYTLNTIQYLPTFITNKRLFHLKEYANADWKNRAYNCTHPRFQGAVTWVSRGVRQREASSVFIWTHDQRLSCDVTKTWLQGVRVVYRRLGGHYTFKQIIILPYKANTFLWLWLHLWLA